MRCAREVPVNERMSRETIDVAEVSDEKDDGLTLLFTRLFHTVVNIS